MTTYGRYYSGCGNDSPEYFQHEAKFDPDYCTCSEADNPENDPINKIMAELRKLIFLTSAAFFGKNLFYKIGEHFLAVDDLPVKMHYVDLWPNTCQKVKNACSKIWGHRTEGSALSGALGGAYWFSWLNSETHPALKSFVDASQSATQSCLKFFGQPTTELPHLFTSFGLFPAIGAATSLALGSHDVISEYFDKDKTLEVEPIFNENLQRDLDEISETISATKEEKGFFSNLLLYGPPGTGKTMISKWIAKNSHMNCMTLSGGDLLKTGKDQSGPGGAVAMLQKLINHAKNLSSPTVVFIDEAEACLKRRDSNKSQELTSLLNAFLELTGQPSSKMMLILATNLPNDLDPAVLSRMGYTLQVDVPQLEQRKQIAQQTVNIRVPLERQAIFSKEIVDHIAKQTEGCSGRDIATIISRLNIEARKQGTLTATMIDNTIKKFMGQAHAIEHSTNLPNPLKKNPFYNSQGG